MRTKYIYSLHKILHKLHFRPHNSEFEGKFYLMHHTQHTSESPCIFLWPDKLYASRVTECLPKGYWFSGAMWLHSLLMTLDLGHIWAEGGFINLKDSLSSGAGRLEPTAHSGPCLLKKLRSLTSFKVCMLRWFLHFSSVVFKKMIT